MEVPDVAPPSPTVNSFQSLFYWKLIWKSLTIACFSGNYYVSILVLLEVDLEDLMSFLIDWCYIIVSILVLLEVDLEEFYQKMKTLIVSCFNPCFIGSWFGSIPLDFTRCTISRFQSLFYWKLIWKFFFAARMIFASMFQSLFYWKLIWKPCC